MQVAVTEPSIPRQNPKPNFNTEVCSYQIFALKVHDTIFQNVVFIN